ncbi:MAG: serine-type D-Ala-D-Ala carboxypeptidase/endopeptidase [Solirubrobacteraceae bacterium]|jgi:D-alanyl-D-alanine-carboxypeptidase/D-alanyl-D-alanine-endopeptidase|nr:serine-type D-Ala-D-Ala carboxypeptidase/endopeptidase [Solirubrobacteraceae bacterium]
MLRPRLSRAALLTCLFAALVPGTSPALAKTKSRRVIEAMDATYTHYKPGLVGLCLGAVDGKVRRIKCYGRVAPGSTNKPDADTLFGIASITKTFTATQLAVQVAQGKVKLGGLVRNFIPPADDPGNFPPNVTLKDLAQHYSGLPRDPPVAVTDFHQLFQLAGDCYATPGCRAKEPETAGFYSNWAFDILGIVLGRHAGFAPQPLPSGNVMPPWEPDLQQQVLFPLGLQHTASFVGFDRAGALPYYTAHVATGVTRTGAPFFTSQFPGTPVTDAGGGLMSSSRDMLKWLRYSMFGATNGALKDGFPLLYRRPLLYRNSGLGKIGLAWNITSDKGYKVVNKDGKLAGYESFISFLQNKSRGVFVLLNDDPAAFAAPDVSCRLLRALPPRKKKIPCPAADDKATTP